jgi:hypothetical protein
MRGGSRVIRVEMTIDSSHPWFRWLGSRASLRDGIPEARMTLSLGDDVQEMRLVGCDFSEVRPDIEYELTHGRDMTFRAVAETTWTSEGS